MNIDSSDFVAINNLINKWLSEAQSIINSKNKTSESLNKAENLLNCARELNNTLKTLV